VSKLGASSDRVLVVAARGLLEHSAKSCLLRCAAKPRAKLVTLEERRVK